MLRRLMLAAVALLAGGCVSAGYRAQTTDARDGYFERRVADARWSVEYVGDAGVPRDRVETYLLYRAAELTVASGYDWFALADHVVEQETEIVVEARRPPELSPVWRPMWRHRERFFWSDWMAPGAQPTPPSEQDASGGATVTRYAAREDIAMGRGAAPPGAFNAREVIALLDATIDRE